MLIQNGHPDRGASLDEADCAVLGNEAADEVEQYLSYRKDHRETPLHELSAMAADVGVAAIHVKDEGQRLGLGSFKALGGAFAVVKLVLEEAGTRLGRVVDYRDLYSPEVRDVAATITVACATDGNHGRSVSQGAQLIGAKAAIFVHSGVSELRKAAIAAFGAQVINVEGNYDDSVAHAAAVAEKQGWLIVSDTSWPGYERVPGLVMQGYTVMVREALRQLPAPPTHVFLQAGVGGFAAAVAGHLSIAVPEERVVVVVVDPARAACLFESAKVGRPVRIPQGEPTVMAMLECYEPSLVAWRILSRLADAFMTVDEGDAVAAMNLLAKPKGTDVPIVAGESGGAGLAGLLSALADEVSRATLGLNAASRILLINTEGATDPSLYESLVGIPPGAVGAGREPDAA